MNDINAAVALLKVGLSVLSQRALVFLVVLLMAGGFLYALIDPSILRIIAASICGIMQIILIFVSGKTNEKS